MAVDNIVENLDKVDESIRSAYSKGEDGKYHLDADAYADLKAAGLKAKNRELLGKVRQTKTSEEKIVDLEKEVRHFKLITPLRDMALKAGMFPERVDLALLELEHRFTLGEDGEIVVLDEKGNPTEMTPQKFLGEIYPSQRGFLYEASRTGGGGAPNNNSKGGPQSNTLTREAFEKLPAAEKMAFSKRGGVLVDKL